MAVHHQPFFRRKAAGFFQNAVRNADLAHVVHGRSLAQLRSPLPRMAQVQGQGLGHEADPHDVYARIVVFVLGGQGKQKQGFMVSAHHFLQGIVALLVHAPQIVQQGLHLAPRRRVELGAFEQFIGHHSPPWAPSSCAMVSISLSGLNGLSK